VTDPRDIVEFNAIVSDEFKITFRSVKELQEAFRELKYLGEPILVKNKEKEWVMVRPDEVVGANALYELRAKGVE